MRNLFPLDAEADVSADMAKAIASGEDSRDPFGYGWQDIHLIEPPAIDYADKGLSLADAAAELETIMPRVRHFYATIGSAIGRKKRDPLGSYEDDAWCFGFGPHCYLKLDTDGSAVSGIWFDLSSKDERDIAALKQALQAIDRLVPSLVADYFTEATFPVANTELLDRYFADRKTQIEDFERMMKERRNR